MMNVERFLNLTDYEIADEITIPEMKHIVDTLDSKLSNILTVHNSKWFPSTLKTLTSMQSAIKVHEHDRDVLVNKYKEYAPAEVNRFILAITELQYIYVKDLVDESIIRESVQRAFKDEGQRLMVKRS
jgi:hypothetical protein